MQEKETGAEAEVVGFEQIITSLGSQVKVLGLF